MTSLAERRNVKKTMGVCLYCNIKKNKKLETLMAKRDKYKYQEDFFPSEW
jgi:hypothetical protein